MWRKERNNDHSLDVVHRKHFCGHGVVLQERLPVSAPFPQMFSSRPSNTCVLQGSYFVARGGVKDL